MLTQELRQPVSETLQRKHSLSHKHKTFHKAASECRALVLTWMPLKLTLCIFVSPKITVFLYVSLTRNRKSGISAMNAACLAQSSLDDTTLVACPTTSLGDRLLRCSTALHIDISTLCLAKLDTSLASVFPYTCKGTKGGRSSNWPEDFVLAQGCWAGTSPDLGKPAGHTVSMAGVPF